MSRRQNVAEISAIHRSTLQSVLLANLYFNYDGPTWGSTVGLLLLQRFRVSLLLSTRLVSSQ